MAVMNPRERVAVHLPVCPGPVHLGSPLVSCSLCRGRAPVRPYRPGGHDGAQGPVSWRPTTVKWRQSSQSNRHSTIGTRQTEYHEVLLTSANDEVRCDCTFADDGNASWYSVCRVPMVEWRLDCEDCGHLTVAGPRDTSPRSWRVDRRSTTKVCSPLPSSLKELRLCSCSRVLKIVSKGARNPCRCIVVKWMKKARENFRAAFRKRLADIRTR